MPKLDDCVGMQREAEDENDPRCVRRMHGALASFVLNSPHLFCRFAAVVDFFPVFGHNRGVMQEILKQGHKQAQASSICFSAEK